VGDGARLHRRVAGELPGGDASSWKARPGVAATREEVLEAAGSRYTYSANTLALDEALEAGHTRLALVGMSCQSSVPPVMWSRKIGKISKPIVFNLGLLCSKTFDDAIFEELFRAKYGIERSQIVKMNIKGVFQLWLTDGSYREVNLKECHAWTRDGCTHCPTSPPSTPTSPAVASANADWTLTIVRTELGREIIQRMIADGSIEARPGDSDPGAIALMRKLAEKSRSRWSGRRRAQRPRRVADPEGLRRATPATGTLRRGRSPRRRRPRGRCRCWRGS
jgi:coenzyme F420 hydrogenase subunit beta